MTQQQQHSMAMTQTRQTTQNIAETNSKEVSFAESRDRELDSQAPPELESVSQGFSMPSQEQGYEPSADELIDVLKNLENLAAGNPNLYRSIVQQIKGNTGVVYQQQQQTTEQVSSSQYEEQQMYEQQMYQEEETYQEQQMYQEQQIYQEQQQQNYDEQQIYQQEQMYQRQHEEETYQQQQQQQIIQQQQIQEQTTTRQQTFSQQQIEESMTSLGMSEEEYRQHMKMKRLEAEAQEEVRRTLALQREAKMKRHAEPPRPKEITVVAGDGKNVKIQLVGDVQDETRKQVAEAAGLKHVPLPDFDNTDDSAWAGSLRKTNKNRREDREDAELQENPWAGTLKHVNQKGRGSEKKEEREDMYGGAPWMGTLRHVVHDNKVTRNYGVNQFQSKRYPDEDAGNPFESNQGSAARPAFPLTPAAIINGSVLSRDEMARKEEEEELERIRSNIGSKTVSSALLQVLMPKLLKMHETKYEPMDKVDAEKIMEEILSMQIGINPNQQADANEEAEMIIRAIMQDEVDKSVYSRMADDLETANKKMKKLKKVKGVKTKAPPITA